MIRNWIIDNFKSIDKEKHLEFRPLTVFSGANSSGKSTILQSILLVSQTLQNPIASRSVVLNGGIKKFGSFSDIVNQRDSKKTIKIGFSLSNDFSSKNMRSLLSNEAVHQVDCDFTLGSDKEKDDLQPYLVSMRLEYKHAGDGHVKMTLTKEKQDDPELTKILDSCKYVPQPLELDYKLDTNYFNDKSRGRFFLGESDIKFFGVALDHFLPYYLSGYYDRVQKTKALLYEYLTADSESFFSQIPDSFVSDPEIDEIIKVKGLEIADQIYLGTKNPSDATQNYFRKVKSHFSLEILRKVFFNLAKDNNSDIYQWVGQLLAALDTMKEKYEVRRQPMYYHPGVEFVKVFFTNHINYLGPLREEPRSLYPLEGSTSNKDIGLKGENSAAVYENNKNIRIKYIDPSGFTQLDSLNLQSKDSSLSEAINRWLIYLGVANDMKTSDKGKFGHELKIITDISNMEQDLTHVGVGVSQVLPILLLALLAEKGDVIILEQPELHLHPKVQTRLADFFIAMNALGKQCIIETHSEYLINRLRYLVAKSPTSKISDNTIIYFVEKEDGHSKYRPVSINQYGVIEDWPKGFFDESEIIAEGILRAGMEKRIREKLNNKH